MKEVCAAPAAVAAVNPRGRKRAVDAAAAGSKSKAGKPSLVGKALAAAARRPVRAKTARESCSDCVQGDEDSDEEPPALRRRSEHRAAAASAGAGPSGAGPSSPAAASHSIPDELSGDEFDEEAEAAFRETPHRMEGDRRADFADREEDSEVDAALDALRTRQADDQSDWSSSFDADSPRRTQPPQPPQPQPPPPPQQLADEEDDDSWAHLEVGSAEIAAAHPPYSELVSQDVCVMEAAFAPDSKLTTRGAVGWRGEVGHSNLPLPHAP